jgi:uncharacterized phage protein (TIGR02220 family)
MPKRENTHRKITIINPESWGVKYNKTAQYYFQFRTDFLGNPQIATLSNGAKLLLLSILSESSRRVCRTVSYCLGFSCGLLKVSLSEAKGFLKELERNEIIELDASVRVTKHNITEHNITEHNTKTPAPIVGDEYFVQAVDYLNDRCCRSFSSSSTATKKSLKKIFDSGYGIDDIEAVIDFKKSEWGENEKMENNLKPSVLFRFSNFEKYADEAQEKKARVKKLLGD